MDAGAMWGKMKHRGQSGNVLFLILIAVALFAALSYAVSSSSRTKAGNTKSENLQLRSAQILQYAATLRSAVQRMVLSGIPADKVEARGANTWDPCTSGTQFCLFGPNGGGAINLVLKPDPDTDVWGNFFSYTNVSDNVTVQGLGTAAPEIILFRAFTYNQKGQEICQAINKGLGISGIPKIDAGNWNLASYPGALGQPAACLQHFTDYYVYYHSLYDR